MAFENKPSVIHLVLLGAVLALLGVTAYLFGATRDAVPLAKAPIQAPSAPSEALPATPEECETAGGVWNACGPACPGASSETPCIQVCVPRCEGLDGTASITLFFSDRKIDPTASCANVYPTSRAVQEDGGYIKMAVEELLKGPSPAEVAEGYRSEIPSGVGLRSLQVRNGTAYVDFDHGLAKIAGACRVTAVRAQIEATLKQFALVKDVVITVNGGSPAEALQP